MTAAKPAFAVGDPVTLKGQREVLTVLPPLTDRPTPTGGWLWLAHSHSAGTHFVLLHEDAIVKKPTRGGK